MNTHSHPAPDTTAGFGTRCLHSCRTLLQQLNELKASVLHQFESQLQGHRDLLQAAVNEAEALAWQTPYPHLFFPALAEEKAIAVSRWAEHQALVRGSMEARAFAA